MTLKRTCLLACACMMSRVAYPEQIDVRVNPGQTLVVRFAQLEPPPAGTDTLWIGYGGTSSNLESTVVQLFDGDQLLGTVNRVGFGSLSAFTLPTSLWVDNATHVDFTSILAGTIDGRIGITPSFSSPTAFVRYVSPHVDTAQATAQNTYFGTSHRSAELLSVEVVPEPVTWLLVLFAIGTLLGLAIRKR